MKTTTLFLALAMLAVASAQTPPAYPYPFESEADRKPTLQTGGNCLIRAGRVVTVTGDTLKDHDILVQGGKIVRIGKNLPAPAGTRVIDARDKVVMPGIVDAHIHRGADATNEGTDAITAEVRILDVLDPDKLNIWQALASGETTGLILHGSANPIGGQSVVVKLKYKKPAHELPIPDAPRMIKFALGENVTRASTSTSTRFPNSRMGVEAVYRRAFVQARAYNKAWDEYNANPGTKLPPRRDVRLEALGDILRGKIWVQCHSYRADEILMMVRLAKEFGFKIGAMQHALEAYKIAPELAAAGVGVSMFSDHWGYKLEAYDAIPAGPALCYRAGVNTSVNTDGTSGFSAIILDAAKLIRAGGLTENEAFRTITINPAKQLGVDHRVGSIEVGKDADLTLWDAHPFSVHAKCTMTLIEGEVFFERRDKHGVGKSPGSSLDLTIPRQTKLLPVPKLGKTYAITGGTVFPVSGPAIPGGTVVLQEGKILAVGKDVSIPGGAIRVNARGLNVYPGMIDAGTALGLAEISGIPVMVDLNETGEFQPDIVAGAAVQRDGAFFGPALCHGITSTLSRPGGGMVSGQASLLNTWGWTSESMAIRKRAGLVMSIPSTGGGFRRPSDADACACFGPTLQELWDGIPHDHENDHKEDHPEGEEFGMAAAQDREGVRPGQDQPGQGGANLAGRMKELSDYLEKAQKYAANPPAERDLQLEEMVPYVTGKLPVFMRVRGIDGIRNGIEIANRFKLKAVLVGANDAWRIADEVKRAGYPVIINIQGGSTLGAVTPTNPNDPYDTPYVVPMLLKKAGIKFALQSEDNAQAFLTPMRAGIFAAYGISSGDVLRSLTLDSAEILGMGATHGSLEAGKVADIILTNGDPLESTTSVLGAFIGGRPVELVSKHTKLRDEYARRITKAERDFAPVQMGSR